MIKATKKRLSDVFEIKDISESRYVLCVEIIKYRPKKLLGMCQEAYIKMVLERFWMYNFKPVDTLVEKGLALSHDQCPEIKDEMERMNSIPYASVI